jgi:hypothetical protein
VAYYASQITNGPFPMDRSTLSRILGVARKTVGEHLDALQAAGVLTIPCAGEGMPMIGDPNEPLDAGQGPEPGTPLRGWQAALILAPFAAIIVFDLAYGR